MTPQQLKQLITYGIYTTALMPLIIFSAFLSPFHFGKVIIFRAAVEILAVLYAALVILDRRFLPKTNYVFWAITLFTAAFGLTTLTSIDFYQSFMGTLERMGGWFTFLHFWMLFVMMISVLRTKEEWLTLLKISVIVSLGSTLYGFLQKTNADFILGSGGRSRIFGTLGNTALFAGYEIVNTFFALFLVLRPGISRNMRYFYITTLILNVIAIFSTAVRGSVLAMVVASLVFAFLYSFAGGNKKLRFGIIAIVGLAILGEGLLILNHHTAFVQNSSYLSRLSDFSIKSKTASTRIWAWQAGLDGWNDSAKTILLGWGPENFNIPFSKHFNPQFFTGPGSETLFDRAHNMFIEVLVTMGLVGFLSYVSLFGVLFWVLRKKLFNKNTSQEDKTSAAVLIAGLTAYIVHNFFIFDTSANFLVFFTTIGFIYWFIEGGQVAALSVKAPMKSSYSKASFAAVSLAVVALVMIYMTDIKPTEANYAATRGIVASWSNDHRTAIDKFREAVSYDSFGSYEIRHALGQYALENYTRMKPEEAQEAILLTIESVKKNLSYQEDYLPYLYLARSYIILGHGNPKSPYNDLAVEASIKALSISPTFVRTYYEVAQAYLNKQDYPTAISYFKKAVELNPTVGLSYWYWGAVEIDHGNRQLGLQLIDKAISTGYPLSEADLARILAVYLKSNDYPHIAAVYEKLIGISPENPQYHASLAATYIKLGKRKEAIAEVRKAVELDASFAHDAKIFLEGLGEQL